MVTLCKTDLEKVIHFLREAAWMAAASPSTRRRNKARMINLLIKKLGAESPVRKHKQRQQ